ncbi:pectinesterase inhibitor 6-like [Corylus avellana]|uniref:pectinesterase inhibitor 6-like n=1 Tax=Corylus avellana TaxID=13451 RepID=UPI00286A91F8|nr:pectinesterase inhibitor 6-like [Corylus avellana]XP_059450993.1 pectinesterase inhibitor 6-like [Corylus avellana]
MNTISKVCLLMLVTLLPSQILAQNLIIKACDTTLYKELCRKTLENDPESRAATSYEVLAKVALKHATSTATQIHDQVKKLLKSSSKPIKAALTDCNELYQDALEQLDDSSTAIITKNYDISTYLSAAMDDADTCDQSIEEMAPGKTPIGNQGTTFSQLCSIVLSIAKQLT